MFAVLQPVEDKNAGFLKRLRAWRKPPVRLEEKRAGDIRYAVLYARCKNGQPNWSRVYRAAGREAGRLILPEGYAPPPGSGVCGYDSGGFRRLMLVNAFFRCLDSADPRLLSVALVDWEGRYGELALQLLRRAAAVRVVTGQEALYEEYTERARRELGAGLIVTGEAGCLESVTAVLAPEGLTGRRRVEGGALVRPLNRLFFSGEEGAPFGLTIDGKCVRLPEPYESLLPAGVDRLDFAAALYDSARPRSLARLLPSYIRKEGLRIPLRSAAVLTAEAARRGCDSGLPLGKRPANPLFRT